MQGKLIVFEGVNGCGKSTQLKICADWLRSQNIPVTTTREPGGTALGEKIRSLLLDPQSDIDPTAELLLYAADRAQHVAKVIKPALQRGDWVLCDRFTWSTFAFQGYGRGHDLGLINTLNNVTLRGIQPDMIIWLSVSPEEGLRRKGDNLDRLESEDLAFHERVSQGYSHIYRTEKLNFMSRISIDGMLPEQEIFKMITTRIVALFLPSLYLSHLQ